MKYMFMYSKKPYVQRYSAMMHLMVFMWLLILDLVAQDCAGVVYVNSVKGSSFLSCGSIIEPCEYLEQALVKTKDGGKIILQGNQTLTSLIVISKNVSIIGHHGATINSTMFRGYAFKIRSPITFTVIDINFQDCEIVSVKSAGVVNIKRCSITYSSKSRGRENAREYPWIGLHGPGPRVPPQILLEINLEERGANVTFSNSSFKGIQGTPVNYFATSLTQYSSYISFIGCTFLEFELNFSALTGVEVLVSTSRFIKSRIHILSSSGQETLMVQKSIFIGAEGAIFVKRVPAIVISECEFRNCTRGPPGLASGLMVVPKVGAAVSIHSALTVVIKKSMFNANTAFSNGGDIGLKEVKDIHISSCSFSNSIAGLKATNWNTGEGNGGSVNLYSYFGSSNITVINSTFTNCTARGSGGAIYAELRSDRLRSPIFNIMLKDCLFNGSKAAENGGAVRVKTDGYVGIESCVFDRNTANMGGGVMLTMYERPKSGIQSLISKSAFTNNKASVGGGVYTNRERAFWKQRNNAYFNEIDLYSVRLTQCKLTNNSAMSSGQSIYNNDHIEINDTLILTYEKYVASHIYIEIGDVHLSSARVQLRRSKEYMLTGKSSGINIRSDEIRLTGELTFSCPINFNVAHIKNTSEVTLKIMRNIPDAQRMKTTTYTLLNMDCAACKSEFYSLKNGSFTVPRLSQKVPPEDFSVVRKTKCNSCPTGAICDASIKAADNYWGYVDGPSKKLSLLLCPEGFCCGSETVPCTSYDTCAIGRSGKLCGTCSNGYKQNFLSDDCIPKGSPCDVNIFIMYFVVYTIGYTLAFVIITNVMELITLVKSFVLRKKRDTESDHTEEVDTSDEEFPIAGFAQICILFYQVAGFLQLKYQGNQQQQQDSGDTGGVRAVITRLFNFRFVIYQSVCPSDELTLPQREMIFFGMKLATLFMLCLLYIFYKIVKSQACCKKSPKMDMRREERSSVDLRLNEIVENKAIKRHKMKEKNVSTSLTFTNMLKFTFIKLLKFYFTPVTKSAFMLVHCVNIADERYLYVYGDYECYSNWQYAILVIILPCLLMFPLCFEMTLRLLKDKLISSWHFLLAAGFPYYAVFLYVKKRLCTRTQAAPASVPTDSEEEIFRRTVLNTEELLFREKEGRSLGWTVIQFYRTLAVIFLDIFLLNPVYRKLAYVVLLLVFIVHDHNRCPYKHRYLNILQSLTSRCLLLVLACNIIPAISYLVNLQTVQLVQMVVEGLWVVELLIYAVVPLSLPLWKLKEYIDSKRDAGNTQQNS